MENITINCGACRDLLPLYAEGMASDESVALTVAHLNACELCRAELARVRANPAPAQLPFKRSMRRAKQKLTRKKTVIAVFASLLAAVMAVVGVIFALTYVTFPADIKPEDVKSASQYYSEHAESFEPGSILPEHFYREQILEVHTRQWFAQTDYRIAVRENEDGSLTITAFCTGYDSLSDRISTPNSVRETLGGGFIHMSMDEPKLQQGEFVWVMRPEPPAVHWKVYFIQYRHWKDFIDKDTRLWTDALGGNSFSLSAPETVYAEYINGTDQIRPELLEHAMLLAEGLTPSPASP